LLRTALFCIFAFLVAAGAACILRARYASVPDTESSYAMSDESNLARYSFLQASQADTSDGRVALVEYVNLLKRIRREGLKFPEKRLRYDLGLAYLRLFRLELLAGNSQAADSYMKLAQQELSSLGWKKDDLATAALEESIDKQEAAEEKLYGSGTGLVHAHERGTGNEGSQN